MQTSLKAIITRGRRISIFVLVYLEGLLARQTCLAYLIDILPWDISSSQISLIRCSQILGNCFVFSRISSYSKSCNCHKNAE